MLGHQRESMPKKTNSFLAGGSNHTPHEESAGPQTWFIISLGPENMPKMQYYCCPLFSETVHCFSPLHTQGTSH